MAAVASGSRRHDLNANPRLLQIRRSEGYAWKIEKEVVAQTYLSAPGLAQSGTAVHARRSGIIDPITTWLAL